MKENERIPLFLLTAYLKSQQTDLTQAQRAGMRRIVVKIISHYTAMPSRRHAGRPDE